MDHKTLGLYVIGAILLAIVAAFIFSSKFRKDVIASEGEAAVLGIINVKGVIIVLLTAIFGGLFAYIIQPAENPPIEPMTTSDAIALLQESDNDNYSIITKDGKMSISCNGTVIGEIAVNQNEDLGARKSDKDWDNWDVEARGNRLGFVTMKVNQEQLIYSDNQNTTFHKGRPYQVGDLNFFFRIDSIYRTYPGNRTKYNYEINFGEGNSEAIQWKTRSEHYLKTNDGHIYIDGGLKRLQNGAWEKNYYVGLGLGQPLYDSINATFLSVDKVNIIAIESRLE